MRILSALQRIEEAGRHALFQRLARGTARGRAGANADARLRAGPLRVLFIMEDAVGDMVLSLPAIRAIAESHPDTTVDVATWCTPAEMLRGVPYVRRTIVFPRGDRRRVHAARTIRAHGPYDAVVDGNVLCRHVRSRSFAMMAASGAHTWVGEGDRGSDYLLNVTVPWSSTPITHLARMLALATPFYGKRVPERRPLLVVSDEERATAADTWTTARSGPRVLINVSTNGSERRWPAEWFVQVATHIRGRAPAASLVVVGLDRDRLAAERTAVVGGGVAVVPTIRELLAFVESADLVVSPDTSVCHMAAAFSRTLVSMHNAGKEQWLPFDTPGVRVVGPVPNDLSLVRPEPVCDAIDTVLTPADWSASKSA